MLRYPGQGLGTGELSVLSITLSIYVFMIAWLVTISALILIFVAPVILYISEFLVRRIAEYDGGSVLGMAAAVGGVGEALKLLVGK